MVFTLQLPKKMDKHRYNFELLDRNENAKAFTIVLIGLNVAYAIFGALMLSSALFICLDHNFSMYIDELDLRKYMTGVYILIAAGILVMPLAFFGSCGAFMKMRSLLRIFCGLSIICFLLEIVGASYLLTHGITDSKIEIDIEKRIYHLMNDYSLDTSAQRSLDIIQEYIGCCGAYGVADYVKWNMVVPYTCFNPVTGNAWYQSGFGYVGCVRGASRVLEKGTGYICAFALILAFLQIFGIISAIFLSRIKYDFKSTHDLRSR